jgi:hypothetical protein
VVGDGDVGPAGPGVADDVGERLLHHPVAGQVDGGRQPPRLALQRHPDLDPGPGRLGDQGVQLGQAGRRGEGGLAGVAVALAEHAQHGVQLTQGLVAGLADRGQRLGGLVGPAVQQVGGDPGLDADHPDGVGDHVVQLPGDPQPLLVDPAPGLLLPGPLGPLGPVAQLGHVRPPGPDRLAPPHRGQHRDGRVQRLAVEHGVAVQDQLDPGGLQCGDARRQPRLAPRDGQGDGPQGREDGELGRPLRVGAGGIRQPGGHGHGQHPERPAAPGQQGDRPHGQQQPGQGVGGPPVGRAADALGDHQ